MKSATDQVFLLHKVRLCARVTRVLGNLNAKQPKRQVGWNFFAHGGLPLRPNLKHYKNKKEAADVVCSCGRCCSPASPTSV